MGKLDKYFKLTHNGKEYVVSELKYGRHDVPIIIDKNVYEEIKDLNKNWHINEKGFVVTNHKISENGIDVVKEISLHDIVMKINGTCCLKPILHINKLGIDNRHCNLIYDTCDKGITKNLKKKSRTITLPTSSGINPEEIPSYVWYIKEDDTHGDRFIVNVGDIQWKSTGSKKVSLKYKLEEAKKYLRYLKDVRNDLFDDYSMNGDLNKEGKKLLNDFFKIASIAGYNKLNTNIISNTESYLEENLNGLSPEEITFLNIFNPELGRNNFR